MKFRLLFLLALWCWTSIDAITDDDAGVVRAKRDVWGPRLMCRSLCRGFRCVDGVCYYETNATRIDECQRDCSKRGAATNSDLKREVAEMEPSKRSAMNPCLDTCGSHCDHCYEYGLPFTTWEDNTQCKSQCQRKEGRYQCMQKCWADHNRKEREVVEGGADVVKRNVYHERCMKNCEGHSNPQICRFTCTVLLPDYKPFDRTKIIKRNVFPTARCVEKCGGDRRCAEICSYQEIDENGPGFKREAVEGGAEAGVVRAERDDRTPKGQCLFICFNEAVEKNAKHELRQTEYMRCEHECSLKHRW